MGEAQGEGEPQMPTRYQLTEVPAPTNNHSFQTACRAIAAVRKAKHEASIGLGKPLASLTITATQDQLTALNPISEDVANAANAPQITQNPTNTDNGYTATVEAPTDQ
jgi:valyl-tRNA synthetase